MHEGPQGNTRNENKVLYFYPAANSVRFTRSATHLQALLHQLLSLLSLLLPLLRNAPQRILEEWVTTGGGGGGVNTRKRKTFQGWSRQYGRYYRRTTRDRSQSTARRISSGLVHRSAPMPRQGQGHPFGTAGEQYACTKDRKGDKEGFQWQPAGRGETETCSHGAPPSSPASSAAPPRRPSGTPPSLLASPFLPANINININNKGKPLRDRLTKKTLNRASTDSGVKFTATQKRLGAIVGRLVQRRKFSKMTTEWGILQPNTAV